jgi:hypothetical protein
MDAEPENVIDDEPEVDAVTVSDEAMQLAIDSALDHERRRESDRQYTLSLIQSLNDFVRAMITPLPAPGDVITESWQIQPIPPEVEKDLVALLRQAIRKSAALIREAK